jgi:hypothetical protein
MLEPVSTHHISPHIQEPTLAEDTCPRILQSTSVDCAPSLQGGLKGLSVFGFPEHRSLL